MRLESGSLPSELPLDTLRSILEEPVVDMIRLLFSLPEDSKVERRLANSLEGPSSDDEEDDFIALRLFKLRGCRGAREDDPETVLCTMGETVSTLSKDDVYEFDSQ